MKRFSFKPYEENDLEGLVQIEQWEVQLNREGLPPKDDPNDGRNPLFQPEMLDKIFLLLGNDDILSCRLVCHTWRNVLKNSLDVSTRVSIPGRSSAKRFLNLLSNPQGQFPFRSLILRCVGVDNDVIVQLLNTYGHSLSELTLWMINLNSLSFLFLPIWCPNLTSLTFHLEGASLYNSDIFEAIEYSPTFLREAWVHPFPSLKTVSLLENLKLFPDDDGMGQYFLAIFENCPSIKRLNVTSTSTATWTLIAPKMAQKPYLMSKLDRLEIDLNNLQLESWKDLNLRLTFLEILNIESDTSPEAFTQLLHKISKTLETLIIEECYLTPNPAETFKIVFPCEMTALKSLTIAAVPEVSVIMGTRKKGCCNVFKAFPNLKECGFLTFQENKELGNQFWTGIFPEKSTDTTFSNAILTQLRVDWYLEDPWVIREIKKCFPSLTELHLLFDGKLLPLIMQEFKDSRLEEFHFAYFETELGISEFDSNMTGLVGEDCQNLLERDAYRNLDPENTGMKVRPAITDWKHLRTLDISYKKKRIGFNTAYNTDCVPLTGVAVWIGFCLLRKLENLILRHFEIEEKFILRMLKKLPLKHMCLSYCTVNYKSVPPRLETLQERFPDVDLTYF